MIDIQRQHYDRADYHLLYCNRTPSDDLEKWVWGIYLPGSCLLIAAYHYYKLMFVPNPYPTMAERMNVAIFGFFLIIGLFIFVIGRLLRCR